MKNQENTTNKSKLIFGIGSSILFVVLGAYIYTTKSEAPDSFYSNSTKTVGIICIVFFAFIGLICVKKLISK